MCAGFVPLLDVLQANRCNIRLNVNLVKFHLFEGLFSSHTKYRTHDANENSFIVRVCDGVEKFVDLMPARDASYLRSAYEKACPNIDLSHDFSCDSCDAEAQINIPFSANFFWPGR